MPVFILLIGAIIQIWRRKIKEKMTTTTEKKRKKMEENISLSRNFTVGWEKEVGWCKLGGIRGWERHEEIIRRNKKAQVFQLIRATRTHVRQVETRHRRNKKFKKKLRVALHLSWELCVALSTIVIFSLLFLSSIFHFISFPLFLIFFFPLGKKKIFLLSAFKFPFFYIHTFIVYIEIAGNHPRRRLPIETGRRKIYRRVHAFFL